MDSFEIEDIFEQDEDIDRVDDVATHKEQTIILIDTYDTSKECDLDDEETEGLTWLETAVCKAAASFLRAKTVQGAQDDVSVLIYNTSYGNMDGQGIHSVFQLVNLDIPTIKRINVLEGDFTLAFFEENIGHGGSSQETRGLAMSNALWAASMLFGEKKGAAERRVMVFTRDAMPAEISEEGSTGYGGTIMQRLNALAERGVALQIFPLLNPLTEGVFNLELFWKKALQAVRGSQSEGLLELEEQVRGLDDLRSIRQKLYRKRTLGVVHWYLGSDGPTIALKQYALFQTASKGSPFLLDKRTNTAVRSSTALLDPISGQQLTTENLSLYFPSKADELRKNNRYPKVYVTPEEVKTLRAPLSKGLTLLGFKPLSSLAPYHQLRPSRFLYPDEKSIQGSWVTFVALHKVMLDSRKMAICSCVRGSSSEPRLVALIAQQEVIDSEWNEQIEPPGMHVVWWPFADDIRWPEMDENLMGSVVVKPSQEQVEAADNLIQALHLDNFCSWMIPNPHLQRHYAVLEAIALLEEPPSQDEVQDETLPRYEDMKSPEIVQAFKNFRKSVWGSDTLYKTYMTAKTKKPSVDPATLPDLSKVVNEGKLAQHTVADLKIYLAQLGLSRSGKKDELIARIRENFSQER